MYHFTRPCSCRCASIPSLANQNRQQSSLRICKLRSTYLRYTLASPSHRIHIHHPETTWRMKQLSVRFPLINRRHIEVLHRRSPRIEPFRRHIDSQPRRVPELLHHRLLLLISNRTYRNHHHLMRSQNLDIVDRLLPQVLPLRPARCTLRRCWSIRLRQSRGPVLRVHRAHSRIRGA